MPSGNKPSEWISKKHFRGRNSQVTVTIEVKEENGEEGHQIFMVTCFPIHAIS